MPFKVYTTSEVAKILHVSHETVRQMVYRGDLECFGSSKPKGQGHRIKIGRNHIRSYMMQHLGKFSDTELSEWGVVSKIDTSVVHQDETVCEKPQYVGDLSVYTDLSSEKTSCITTYTLCLNDRIAVGNITAETAMKIVEAIMQDPFCDVTSFKIERMN